MKKNTKKKITSSFTGNIDQLLNHCTQLDTETTDEQLNLAQREAGIQYIMNQERISYELATEIYNRIAYEQIGMQLKKLIEEGIVEIDEFNENGEPLYKLTEFGKLVAEEIQKKNIN
jgi:hypothetical protein